MIALHRGLSGVQLQFRHSSLRVRRNAQTYTEVHRKMGQPLQLANAVHRKNASPSLDMELILHHMAGYTKQHMRVTVNCKQRSRYRTIARGNSPRSHHRIDTSRYHQTIIPCTELPSLKLVYCQMLPVRTGMLIPFHDGFLARK